MDADMSSRAASPVSPAGAPDGASHGLGRAVALAADGREAALRPVTAKPLASASVRGERPHLGWVEISKLVIDDRYQRPLQRHNWDSIRRIAENFDWALFTVCDVAPVGGGRYSVIDGQHRVHAALMAGIDKVPVRIVLEPVEGQARAFMGINGNVTAITPFHVLRASLVAGEAWALAAQRAIAQAGCRLMTRNGSTSEKKPGEIYAVQFVRSMVERSQTIKGEDGVYAQGLATLHAACASLRASAEGSSQPVLWSSTPLRAWVTALDGLGDWLDHPSAVAALTGFLDDAGLLALLSQADEAKRLARREGRSCPPISRLLMTELQTRLDAAFPAKAALIAAGGARS